MCLLRVFQKLCTSVAEFTADTALRLARYFKTNAEFWLNLQNFYDLELSRRSETGSRIERQGSRQKPRHDSPLNEALPLNLSSTGQRKRVKQ